MECIIVAHYLHGAQQHGVAHMSLMECTIIVHCLHIVVCFNLQLNLRATTTATRSRLRQHFSHTHSSTAAQQRGVAHMSLECTIIVHCLHIAVCFNLQLNLKAGAITATRSRLARADPWNRSCGRVDNWLAWPSFAVAL